jgi:class 3 adenylate cyclase/tetratricopeptide (TPR) repeat protein
MIIVAGLSEFFQGFGQSTPRISALIDSLQKVAASMPDDTNKVMLLNRLSFEYNAVSPYDGIRYGVQAMTLGEQLGYKQGIARANSSIGANYFSLSDYPNAYQYWLRALELNRETNNVNGETNHLHNIGMVFFTQKNYQKALEYYHQALELSQKTGNNRFVTNSYTAIGNVYAQLGDYARSLEYHYKALALDEQGGNRKAISTDLINIAAVQTDQGDYERALENASHALAVKKELGDKNGMTKSYHLIGKILLKRSKANAPQQEDLMNARLYLDSAVVTGNEIGLLENLQSSYELLAQIYTRTGDYERAMSASESYHSIKDSIFSVSRQNEIFNLEMKAAKVQQDKKDELASEEIQKQKLLRNAFIGGFGIVLLFSFVFFIQRNKISRSKKRSDELLLNILPGEVAEELKAKGSTEARLLDNVTVLFTDFKGFTQLAEQLTPKELVTEINTCFSAFDLIVKKHNVEKIKTIGDAYMAAGGLPTPNETHPVDVVKAAIDICRYMEDYKTQRKTEGKPYFEIRIGVHTGPVVAGVVGLNKFAYDIWGDTVNTASRMESSGEPGKVNISGVTHRYVGQIFNCTYRGKIEAKGKGQIDMYFVQ